MVILVIEWEKTSGFQQLVSGFLFPLSKETNGNKFWVCVSRNMFIYFIIFYILNKSKVYNLCNSDGFGYRWVDLKKPIPPISTRLQPKMCDWQPDDPQWPVRLTIFRIGLFDLNRFADFYPPLGICGYFFLHKL
jgi:hypothetical protein